MNIQSDLFQSELRDIARLPLPYADFANKTVAVTGAGGLIGRYMLYALDAINRAHHLNLRLIALCRNPERTMRRLSGIENLTYMQYDARLPLNADLTADYILHAASNAHPIAFSGDPVGTMQANVLGTMNLLEAARRCNARFLMCSTGEIYGENPAIDAFSETDFGMVNPMNPRSCYPEGKRAAETLCACYAAQYGVHAMAARITYTYGPTITDESSRADAQFLRRAMAGEDIVLKSSGSQVRSYCYAADTIAALITLLLTGELGQAYNVANPDCSVSIREYAETLARIAGVRVIFELPPDQERAGYSKVNRAVLNAEKLMRLGWKPKYDLAAGLAHTIEICK